MLTVTGLHDGVPILPTVWIEWREVFEYGASILLAFVSGNILGVVIFQVLPRVLSQGGKPNAFAFRMARLLGQHVGEEQLRRRARLIQDLMQTVGPLVGVAATAVGLHLCRPEGLARIAHGQLAPAAGFVTPGDPLLCAPGLCAPSLELPDKILQRVRERH